jgi:hypothetical protein
VVKYVKHAPRKINLPEAAYVQPEVELVPEFLRDLETAPGRCYSPSAVEMNCPAIPGVVCTKCCLAELGETMMHLSIRTSQAIPKERYYRDLDAAQAKPDREWRRQWEYSRTWSE